MSSLKFILVALAAEAGIAWAALTTGSRMTPFADNGSLLRELGSRLAAQRGPAPGPAPGKSDELVAPVRHADPWPRPRSRTVRSPASVFHPRRGRGDIES